MDRLPELERCVGELPAWAAAEIKRLRNDLKDAKDVVVLLSSWRQPTDTASQLERLWDVLSRSCK